MFTIQEVGISIRTRVEIRSTELIIAGPATRIPPNNQPMTIRAEMVTAVGVVAMAAGETGVFVLPSDLLMPATGSARSRNSQRAQLQRLRVA